MDALTRRSFTRGAGLAGALSYPRILGASDRVRVGHIGLGNRGDQVHDAFLEHPCNCDIKTGHHSTSATLIANIAHRTRSYLEWDGRAERFTNNEPANRYLFYKYRASYRLG